MDMEKLKRYIPYIFLGVIALLVIKDVIGG